jgi:hypothetical protein
LLAAFIYQRFGFLPVAVMTVYSIFLPCWRSRIDSAIVILPRILPFFIELKVVKYDRIIFLGFRSAIHYWLVVDPGPALYGLPPSQQIRGAFASIKTGNLQADETLYDLGAGDGRVLLIAAREFHAKAVGIEIGPVQCVLIWLRVVASGFGNHIQVKWGNYLKADLSQADVVFLYATSKEVLRVAAYLEQQMNRFAWCPSQRFSRMGTNHD